VSLRGTLAIERDDTVVFQPAGGMEGHPPHEPKGAVMTTPAVPEVECERHHTSLAVSDVMAAAEFYTRKLGFRLGFTWGDPPAMAGVNLGDVQIFLQKGTPNPSGIYLHFVVGDADELYEFHRANGVEILQPLGDREYGIRDYAIRDLDGYTLEFGHRIYSVGEPIPIERVDVPLRLEKRLAALLHDLAEHRHMSLSSCLEEILLHTNDGVGPHNTSTLRRIQELKKKHGIDYDTHGSYRFREA
jgi:catechol 2,3-dioxygenase-like lactoylglutathione lyase family enzyme